MNFQSMAMKSLIVSLHFLLSACANNQPINIESHIGLYAVVAATCDPAEGEFNTCENTHFIELVKGQFMGVADAELAYVFWSGNPKLDPELQYEAHPVVSNSAPMLGENKFWLSNNDEVQEYFSFSNGKLTGYQVAYKTGNEGAVRKVHYQLTLVNRGSLPQVRLNYPGNK